MSNDKDIRPNALKIAKGRLERFKAIIDQLFSRLSKQKEEERRELIKRLVSLMENRQSNPSNRILITMITRKLTKYPDRKVWLHEDLRKDLLMRSLKLYRNCIAGKTNLKQDI